MSASSSAIMLAAPRAVVLNGLAVHERRRAPEGARRVATVDRNRDQ
jgi:hypothetical protein